MQRLKGDIFYDAFKMNAQWEVVSVPLYIRMIHLLKHRTDVNEI
jgi:hypothetical protein